MKFYDLKKKEHVEVADKECTKSKSQRANGTFLYTVRAVTAEGHKVTSLLSEAAYKALKCKEA